MQLKSDFEKQIPLVGKQRKKLKKCCAVAKPPCRVQSSSNKIKIIPNGRLKKSL